MPRSFFPLMVVSCVFMPLLAADKPLDQSGLLWILSGAAAEDVERREQKTEAADGDGRGHLGVIMCSYLRLPTARRGHGR